MRLVPITAKNSHVFEVFEQDYEAEFSAITKKEPNAEGRFAIEADWREPNSGFYFFLNEKPAGFVIRTVIEERSDIAEFYILPCYRKRGFGKAMAFAVFDLFPGPWQVRQILTATEAVAFWRTIIREYTHGDYTEDQASDPYWGTVVRQLFHVKPSAATMHVLKGKELLSNIPELTKLRLTIYREYPYLYEGDPLFEESYVSLFANSSDALLIVAKVGNRIVGALSGLPLDSAQKEIQDVFLASKMKLKECYALCDVVVLKEYRNRRVATILYEEFANQLRKMKRYKKVVLWQIVRAQDDPKRPNDYFSPDNFFGKQGFKKHPEYTCVLRWKEISEKEERAHRFEFWLKDLS